MVFKNPGVLTLEPAGVLRVLGTNDTLIMLQIVAAVTTTASIGEEAGRLSSRWTRR